ncbi:TPA: DUF2197 domain-containing protein [Staphylococcus aureus]|nr:DUF2197 domain-containing protein [Staphylococcus aureus]
MRQVQCIICDAKVFIDERTTESKRLKNNPIRTFMCDDCKSRNNVHNTIRSINI